MFCINCGKELPDHARFCNACGARQVENTNVRREEISHVQTYEKVFNFPVMSNNESNSIAVNKWLREQHIVVKSIALQSTYNQRSWTAEEVLVRCSITYEQRENTPFIYQMGYLKKKVYFPWNEGNSELDQGFEDWKKSHSECKVVWSNHAGHTISGSSVLAIFFFYITERKR